jgi:hypothetical protein
MEKQMIVQFQEWACKLVEHKYQDNGRIALKLVDETTGEPIADATVNIPDAFLLEGEVCIPEYKYQGMVKALVEAGVVEETGNQVKSGHITAPICKLLI